MALYRIRPIVHHTVRDIGRLTLNGINKRSYAQISGYVAILNAKFASATWTWGAGPTADSITVETNADAPLPEPASLALFGAGLTGLVLLRRRASARFRF
jgi:hypothetical protein